MPTQQPVKVPVPHLEFQPDGHPPLLERVKHLFSYMLGVELPDVLTLALTAPDVSVNDALFAEGLSDLDLDAVTVLAVPLWAIPAADRGSVAALCRGVVAQIREDSSRESSMLAGQHEQTSEDDLQDHQLAQLQSGAEAARITDRLVRSLDAVGSHSVGASRPSAGL